MRRRLAWLLAAAVVFVGCDGRRAGTETGNPEIIVSARFMVLEYGRSITSGLHFQVMGMMYSVVRQAGIPDSGECWTRPGGTLANFADFSSKPLPDTVIEDKGPWNHAEIILRIPEGPAGIPDSVDIGAWSSPLYAKFELFLPEERFTTLFEMPQGTEYRLRFGNDSTEAWRIQDTLWIPFFFNAMEWTDTLASMPGLKPRRDGRDKPYLLLSPSENVEAWNALKARLPESFYADSVVVSP